MNKLETLKQVYAKNLELAHAKYPNEYMYPALEIPYVLLRMNAAIDNMSFNKDSHAWKMTCKELGIKHTYKAIKEFIKE